MNNNSTTDMAKVIETSKVLFDAVEIKSCGILDIVQHPFTNNMTFGFRNDDGEVEIYRLDDKEGLKKFRTMWFDTFDKAEEPMDIYIAVSTPWKLTWLKFVKDYLSEKDFAELFADAWVQEENPNDDANVKIRTLISWFRGVNKSYLMEEDDYKVWESLPDEFDVYRGVAIGRVPYGLSWTRSREKAEWFQHRFEGWQSDESKKTGYLEKAHITKEDALAYFNTRNEDEVIVDVLKIKKAGLIERV